jgi:transposase-like protein
MTRSETEREQLLQAYENSGQSVVEFSRAQGIEPSYMYSLTRKRRERKSFIRVGVEPTVTISLAAPLVRIETKLSDLAQVLRQLEVQR